MEKTWLAGLVLFIIISPLFSASPGVKGAMGSLWFYTGQEKNACLLPEAEIKSVTIKGNDPAARGADMRSSYRAVVSPAEALSGEFKPILFTWRVSANGRISGQGSRTIDVTWEKSAKQSWVQVTVSNKCSSAGDKKIVFIARENDQ